MKMLAAGFIVPLLSANIFAGIAQAVPSAFSTWLYQQRVPVPAHQKKLWKKGIDTLGNINILNGVKNSLEHFLEVDIAGGNCTNAKIGSTLARDLHESGKVRLEITGVGLKCGFHLSRPHVAVDVAVADSTIILDVDISPFILADGSSVPLGSIHIALCDAQVKFTYQRFHQWTFESAPEPNDEVGSEQGMAGLKAWAIDNLVSRLACEGLEKFVNYWGKGILSRFAGVADSLVSDQPSPPPPAAAPLLDWGVYPPVLFVGSLLTGRMEAMMKTETVQSMLQFAGRKFFTKIGNSASLELGDVQVHGVVTPRLPQVVLRGVGPELDLWASIRQLELAAGIGLTLRPVDAWATPSLASTSAPLIENLNITLSLNNISFALRLLSMVSEPGLSSLEVDQLQSLDCVTSCASQATYGSNRSIRINRMAFNAFPGLLRAGASGSLEDDVLQTIQESAVLLLRDAVPALASLSRGAANFMIEQLLTKSLPCPATTVYYGIPTMTRACFWLGIACALFGFSVAGLGMLFQPTWWHRGEDTRGIAPMFGGLFDGTERDEDEEDSSELPGRTSALCFKPAVPFWLAASYPFMVIATIFLFLYGDFSLGTTLEIVFTGNGQRTVIGPVFSFSLISIIKDSYLAGAYLFAGLAAVMSGVWPLMKLVLLLLCWLAPESCWSPGLRGFTVTFLDQYGKYSLVDIWLGVIGLASYNLHWEGPNASIKVQPVVLDGFFVFIIATVSSLILGHVAAICHKWTQPCQSVSRATSGVRSSPGSEVTGLEDIDDEDQQYAVLRSVTSTCAVIFLLLMTPVLVFLGTTADSFQMLVGGMAAEMLTDPWGRVTRYSAVTLGVDVAAANSLSPGLRMIQGVVYLFTILLPVLLSGMLITLWILIVVRPRKRALHANILIVCRILDAWSALDVFAVAVLVSALEIKIFARYLILYDNIHVGCMWVKDNLNTSCMECTCELLPGFFLLALAGFMSYALPKVIFHWVSEETPSESEDLSARWKQEYPRE